MKPRIGFTCRPRSPRPAAALALIAWVLALLALAAPARAALPEELNNTRWTFTGIQFNSTSSLYPAVFSGTVDSNGTAWNNTGSYADNQGSLNGSLTLTDYAGNATAKAIPPHEDGGWLWMAGQNQDAAYGVPTPLEARHFNPDTNDTATQHGGRMFMAPLDGYGAVVGVSYDQTFQAGNSTNGTLLSVLVSKAVPEDSALAGTWKYYALAAGTGFSAEHAGKLVLNQASSSGQGSGQLYLTARENGAEDFGSYNVYQVEWSRSGNGLVTVVDADNASQVFLKDACADASKLALYSVHQDLGMAVYAVAVKGGTFSASNLDFRFNLLAAGADAGTNATALLGYLDVTDGGLVSSSVGNETYVQAGSMGFKDLTGQILSVQDVTLNATHTHSRITFPDTGNFTGSMRNDRRMLAGIYHHEANSAGMLMFIVGLASEAGPVLAPASAAQITALTGLDPANATMSGFKSGDEMAYVVNSTRLDAGYGSVDANFTDSDLSALVKSMQLGDEDIISSFPGTPGNFVRVTPAWPPFRWGLNSTSGSPLVLVSWTIETVGAGLQYKRVSDLDLYKFKYNKDMSVNETLRYTLRVSDYPGQPVSSIPNKSDGDYWVTDAAYNKTALEATDYFRPASQYVIWTLIRDNGPFDSDATPGQVADPPAGTTGGGGGSTSSGCTFNPAGTLDSAWLAVLALPLAALVLFRRKS